jgi:hypothetical protein
VSCELDPRGPRVKFTKEIAASRDIPAHWPTSVLLSRELWMEARLASPAWLIRPRPGSSASTRTGFVSAYQLRGMLRLCTTYSRTPRLCRG